MNPILSIFLAVLITIFLVPFLGFLDLNLGMLHYIVFVLGGGLALWFSTRNRIRYSLYYGLIIAIYFLILFYFYASSIDFLFLVLILIFSVAGGYIAKNVKVKL